MNCPACNSTRYEKTFIDKQLVSYCKRCGYTNKPGLRIPPETEESKY